MRLEDWPARLAALLAADEPFAWGTNDCGLFACQAFEAVRGHHPALWFVGRYRTEGGAARALRRYHGTRARGDDLGRVAALVMARNDCPGITPPLAKRGDWVMFHGTHGDTLGVCAGTTIASPTDQGIGYSPMATAYRAWRV